MSKASTNERRSAQLGTSFGAACGQLRKRLLFFYAQKCGDDKCYVCEKPIETVADLSIEHKQPWLDVSPDLFWDLDNIAFSHLRCNKPHRIPHKISVPDGTSWCWRCQEALPISMFAPSCVGSNKQCTKCASAMKKSLRKRTGKH